MHIIVLLGSSTAGKSTLCSELKSEYKWNVVGIDDVCSRIRLPEHEEKLRSIISDELRKNALFEKLEFLMSEEEIIKFCASGELSVSMSHPVKHQFLSPPTPGDLQDVLNDPLIQSGYDEAQIKDALDALSKVVKLGGEVFKKSLMDRLYDEAFKLDSDATVVLDLVPDCREDASVFLDDFANRAGQYREEFGEQALTTSVIFAYCPPNVLSGRIRNRNLEAEHTNPENKREGVFPFEQLSRLISAGSSYDEYKLGTLSKDQVLNIVATHSRSQPPKEVEMDTRTERNRRLGEKLREYKYLTQSFGLWNHTHDEQVPMTIRENLHIDGFINTALQNPTQQLLQELDRIEASRPDIKKTL